MHRLLELKIKKIFKKKFEDLPVEFQKFILDIDEAYQESDRTQGILERIQETSAIELDKFREKEKEIAILQSQISMLESVSRFVPRQFLKYLGKDDIREVQLGNAVKMRMTVLFADIRRFSSLSEKMSVEDNFKFLNAFLKRMGPCIRDAGGFIDKFMGDGIMALFPLGGAGSGVSAAIELQKALRKYNKDRLLVGYVPLEMGIGLNTGNLMLGTVGSSDRLATNVIGDSVNLASRLESLTSEMGVNTIISEYTFAELADPSVYKIRNIGKVKVVGKDETVQIYEIFDADDPDVIERKIEMGHLFEKALISYQQGNFIESIGYFQQCFDIYPDDKAVIKYIERCTFLLRYPSIDNWQGVVVMSKI